MLQVRSKRIIDFSFGADFIGEGALHLEILDVGVDTALDDLFGDSPRLHLGDGGRGLMLK